MTKELTLKETLIAELKEIVEKNPTFDIQHAEIKGTKILKELKWDKSNKNPEEMLVTLRAYQRLIRIIPEKEKAIAFELLNENIHSALQIAGMPVEKFAETYKHLFEEKEDLAKTIHKNAQYRRSQIVMQYMDEKQNNEPHAKSAKI